MVSNASSQAYPQNTIASFTNFLPDKNELDGSWEVALVEVSYAGIYYNIEGGLMTFHYDEKFKHVFAIQPAVFNSMDEFAISLTDILKKARHPKNLDPQFSINIDKKSGRLNFCNRGSQNVSFSKNWPITWLLKLTNLLCLVQKDHTIPSPGQRQISLLILLENIQFYSTWIYLNPIQSVMRNVLFYASSHSNTEIKMRFLKDLRFSVIAVSNT